MSELVLSQRREGVTTLTLNRPERLNAINDALVQALRKALSAVFADSDTRVIVLNGAGRAFCSGDDLEDFPAQSRTEDIARRYLEDLQDVTRLIVMGEKMVVGAVHGWAVGGGLEWAIDCDLLLLAEGTRLNFPEVKWGMVPTGGISQILPRKIGLSRAQQLILFGEVVDAKSAHDMGLAWKIVPGDQLLKEAQATAARIAALPDQAVRSLKRTLARSAYLPLEDVMAMEVDAVTKSFIDPATAARVADFRKQKPK
ncbi:MAG TPA: enoyl-CoA hydratase/isomerase family protein [Dongiaceae bacterium]|jgi:enoyl-CoA hydratase/carnithine racemase|nr:enoyl-CoA hydratase/isomerase family protein [Dongiaceae bacterium]